MWSERRGGKPEQLQHVLPELWLLFQSSWRPFLVLWVGNGQECGCVFHFILFRGLLNRNILKNKRKIFS